MKYILISCIKLVFLFIMKIDIQEMGCEGMDWIELAQDRDR